MLWGVAALPRCPRSLKRRLLLRSPSLFQVSTQRRYTCPLCLDIFCTRPFLLLEQPDAPQPTRLRWRRQALGAAARVALVRRAEAASSRPELAEAALLARAVEPRAEVRVGPALVEAALPAWAVKPRAAA